MLQSLSEALHTFKPSSCLLNADNYWISCLAFKGLNATTQTFLLVHRAPLNCLPRCSLKKKKKNKYVALETSLQQYAPFICTHFKLKQRRAKTRPAKPRMGSPHSQVTEEQLHTQGVFLNAAQHGLTTPTRKPSMLLPK